MGAQGHLLPLTSCVPSLPGAQLVTSHESAGCLEDLGAPSTPNNPRGWGAGGKPLGADLACLGPQRGHRVTRGNIYGKTAKGGGLLKGDSQRHFKRRLLVKRKTLPTCFGFRG